METPTDRFLRQLTQRHRVVVVGGLAVIAHGFDRLTYAGDVWLDPVASSDKWASALQSERDEFEGLTLHRLPGWVAVAGESLSEAVEETDLVRIIRLECPLDDFFPEVRELAMCTSANSQQRAIHFLKRSSKAANYLESHPTADSAARVPVAKQPCMR